MGYYLWILCAESLYMFKLLLHFYYVLFTFCFDCVLFSKIESFVLGLSFDFFVFYLVLKNLKVAFKRIFYSVLIWVYSGLSTM